MNQMNKFAHAEMLGRDYATRIFLSDQEEDLVKAASANMEIDEDIVDNLEAIADEVEFRDHQQKLAHNTGVFSALTKVAYALEEGADIEDLYEHLTESIEKIAMEMPGADSEEEDDALYEYMVKGASDMFGALYGVEVDEDLEDMAAAYVADAIDELAG